MRLTHALADDFINAFTARLSGGSVVIYAGPRPTDLAAGVQRALVRFPLPAPAFLSAANGAALAYPVPVQIIQEAGEAVWAQFQTAAGVVLADGSVGPDASNDVQLSKTTLERNGTVELTSLTIRLPLGDA